MKKNKYPEVLWRKYHSCCDWFYEDNLSGRAIIFCGLDPDREKKMKEFEKGKTFA